ncbi:GNAT family protein [Nonomuraea longicatena]|uniref:GNAT family N-acetyltransferase n=1 Tax=Nonomuraea longicatena TaxID=83682 RepID=UPI0031D402B7
MFAVKPTLVGERVTLRPVGPDDLDGLVELVEDEEGARLTGSHASGWSREALREWYSTRGAVEDRLDLAVVADGEYVGEVVLNKLDTDNLSCNLRIALVGPRAFGRGYGTEALRLTVDHAFRSTTLHRIGLEVYNFNERARHVYKKVGFVEEGVLRDALLWEGQWYDAVVMSVLRPDWKPLP